MARRQAGAQGHLCAEEDCEYCSGITFCRDVARCVSTYFRHPEIHENRYDKVLLSPKFSDLTALYLQKMLDSVLLSLFFRDLTACYR